MNPYKCLPIDTLLVEKDGLVGELMYHEARERTAMTEYKQMREVQWKLKLINEEIARQTELKRKV